MRDKEKVERTKKVRVLIDKHTDHGLAKIVVLEKNGMQATQIIQVFNDIDLLNPVETKDQVLEFLQGPVEYFDKSLQRDLKFSSKHQPIPKAIAGLFGIEYDDIVKKIAVCKLRDLDKMVWNGETVEFDQAFQTEVMESFHEYAQTPAENKAVIEAREVCRVLNKYCEQMDVDSSSMHMIAENLSLKMVALPGALQSDRHKYKFKEHITVIRDKLEYQQIHSK